MEFFSYFGEDGRETKNGGYTTNQHDIQRCVESARDAGYLLNVEQATNNPGIIAAALAAGMAVEDYITYYINRRK